MLFLVSSTSQFTFTIHTGTVCNTNTIVQYITYIHTTLYIKNKQKTTTYYTYNIINMRHGHENMNAMYDI
jgi:hypothetical protein